MFSFLHVQAHRTPLSHGTQVPCQQQDELKVEEVDTIHEMILSEPMTRVKKNLVFLEKSSITSAQGINRLEQPLTGLRSRLAGMNMPDKTFPVD